MTLEVTLHECKVLVKSDDSTYINVMLNDGKTETGAVFKYEPVDMFDLIDWIKSGICDEHNQFFEGQRVIYGEYGLGTVISLSEYGYYGVEFDKPQYDFHRCDGFKLVWGRSGKDGHCWWINPNHLTAVKEVKLSKSEMFFTHFKQYLTKTESD